MKIKRESIEMVREAADIVEVASEFTALRKQGSRYTGICPYPDHQEKTPSFSVDPDNGLYHCFGCKVGGDAIKLVMDLENLPFTEAVSRLADQNSIQLQLEGKQQGGRQDHRELYRCLAAAAAYYSKYLLNSESQQAKNAKSYLTNRGFGNSTIVDFRVGYAPSGSGGFLGVAEGLGFGGDTLEKAGLLSSGGGERFRGRVTFPISDRRGRVVGFGGRVLGEGQPKYLNSPESGIFSKRRLLYGISQAMAAVRRERVAIVVEGYTDVLMLHQSGIGNAVATLGTAITPEHLKTLSGYADRIYVLFDPDAAGEKAIQKAAVAASELKLDLRVLRLAEDPADWLLGHSATEFNEVLEKSEPILEHVIRRIAEDVRGAEATSRSRAVPEVKEFVGWIEDPVQRREAERLAAEALGVDHGVLQQPGRPSRPAEKQSSDTLRDPLKEAAEHLLSLMLLRPDLAEGILKNGLQLSPLGEPLQLTEDDLGEGSEEAQIFHLLKGHAGEDLNAVLADERARPLMDRIGKLSSQSEKVFPSWSSIQEAVLRLAILGRQRRKNQSADYDEKERLHAEIRTLEQALRNMPVVDT